MDGEDAFKNYYTLAWYLDHNAASLHFEGMNYPYGEHVLFTDNQPIIAATLKAIDSFVPVGASLPMVMMMLIFASCVLGVWALFKITEESGAPVWFNALTCTALILLSPQLQRMNGHYSLAYAGLIPMALWLDYRCLLKPVWHRHATLLVFLLALGFVHPYLLVMSSGWLLLGRVALHLMKRQGWKSYLRSLLWLTAPVVIFQVFMALTDPVTDRPSDPYGFLVYKASIESVFLPIGLPYFSSITQALSEILHPSAEGFFYLGMSSILAFGLILLGRLRRRTLFREDDQGTTANFIYAYGVGAIPILLLAMGLPFAIPPLEEFLPLLGPLKQFRGIGRFVFVAYVAIGLNLLWFLGKEYQRWAASMKLKHLFAPAALSLLLLFEAWNYRSELLTTRLPQLTSVETPALSLDVTNYQCIYPLPYFHIGSEVFRTKAHQHILRKSLELSLATGIPLNAVQMSRTSLAQTIAQFDLSTEVNDFPPVLVKYNSERPVLLVFTQGEELNVTDRKLRDVAQYVGTWNGLELRSLRVGDIQLVLQRNLAAVAKNCAQTDSLGSSDLLFFDAFDDDQELAGRSEALNLVRSDQNDLLSMLPQDAIDTTGAYMLSFWIDASHPAAVNTQLLIREFRNDSALQYELFEVTDRIVMLRGHWALIEVPFERMQAGSTMQMILYRDGEDRVLTIDDLMLRQPSSSVCLPAGPININNRIFEPSAQESVPLRGD